MKVMVRGERRSGNWLGFCFSTVMLLSIAQVKATASFPITAEATNKEVTVQSHISALEQARELNIDLPSAVNRVEDTKVVIRLRQRRVYVYRADRVQVSYPIAIGRTGWETPTGTFRVLQMLQNPAWEHPWTGQVIPPGPNNPLGTRWIGFWTDGKNFIGFHGTPNEGLIGQAVSHGCIRMRNRDAIALYEQVKIGTPVIVQR